MKIWQLMLYLTFLLPEFIETFFAIIFAISGDIISITDITSSDSTTEA